MGKTGFSVNVDEVVRKYADMVYRLAVANTNVSQDAEDVFQEVFIRLVRYKDRIEDEDHLKAWLIRVTINEARRLETSGWKKNVSLDVPDEVQDEVADENDGEASPEEQYLADEKKQSVLGKVRELPQKYREVIHLFYYEEMKITEIADILETNEATVKTRLRRAKDILGKTLKGGI
ncbi:MAG TPA: RNA polymerase subunit sigma-24 [Lachnospiraceae bacterium]|nr:sigma-70 family RNA polymerase sigma factor [Eubacterium sp.]HBZ03043.1 RNA polymerase subunit sigma-24 [Lachnospiraceae bacterium]